jgi:hypothetical protein
MMIGRERMRVPDSHSSAIVRLDRNGPDREIYTMRGDSTDIRRIAHNKAPDLHPDWQPLPGR